MNKLYWAIVWLLFCIAISGCTNYEIKEGSNPPLRIRDRNFHGSQIRWNNVSILDQSIKHKILVDSTNSMRTQTGTLKVWVVLKNRTDYPIQVEIRTSFYDSSKAPLEGPTAWNRIFLPPNAIEHYEEFSTKTQIGFYHIEIREGR